MRPSQHKRKPTTPTNDHEEERVLERRQDHGRNGHRRCHRRRKGQNRMAPAGLDQFRAARQGDLFALRQILGTQESGDANKQSWTALHFACEKGHLHIVEYLVGENHWNANAPDHQKRTPLHIAAAHGHVRVVRYLVGGPCVYMDAVDAWGNTALHLACKNFHVPVVRCLLQHETPQEPCLLHKRNRYVETVLWMLSRAPSSNAATKRWRRWACDSESDDERGSNDEAGTEAGADTGDENSNEDEEEYCSPAELVELVERLYVIPYEIALLSPGRATATPPWNIVFEHKFPFGREAQATLSRQLATYLAPPAEDYREAKKFVVAMRRYAWFTKGLSNETAVTTTTTNTPPQNLRMGFRLENNHTTIEDNLVGDWGRL